jgi:hypothetical protein
MTMSFWNLSDGEDVKTNTTGEFEQGGGRMEVIPDNTSVLAAIDEAKWDRTMEQDRYISLRWTVLAPEEFKNRKIFQKVWALDPKPNTKPEKVDQVRDKAKRMLAAIDMNAGGKLLAKGEMPTDESLTACLTNKPMVIKVMVWEMPDRQTGGTAQGNWVGAVSPKSSPVSSQEEIEKNAAAMAKRPPATGGGMGGGRGGSRNDMDDEIPF